MHLPANRSQGRVGTGDRRGRAPVFAAVCLSLVMSGFAWDETAGPGLVLHFRTTSLGVSGEDVRNETQTTYYGESAMRSVSAAQDSILFFSKRKFVSLNHQAKTYSELTFEEMERTLGGLADGAQSA